MWSIEDDAAWSKLKEYYPDLCIVNERWKESRKVSEIVLFLFAWPIAPIVVVEERIIDFKVHISVIKARIIAI